MFHNEDIERYCDPIKTGCWAETRHLRPRIENQVGKKSNNREQKADISCIFFNAAKGTAGL